MTASRSGRVCSRGAGDADERRNLLVVDVIMDGVVFGKSSRWHDEQSWVSDWGAVRIYSVGADGGA